jgi:hypothetical protein
MPYVQSRFERCWNGLAVVVCLAAAADIAYWRRGPWEGLLVPLLLVVAGSQFARLVGIFPPAGQSTRDEHQGPG